MLIIITKQQQQQTMAVNSPYGKYGDQNNNYYSTFFLFLSSRQSWCVGIILWMIPHHTILNLQFDCFSPPPAPTWVDLLYTEDWVLLFSFANGGKQHNALSQARWNKKKAHTQAA